MASRTYSAEFRAQAFDELAQTNGRESPEP